MTHLRLWLGAAVALTVAAGSAASCSASSDDAIGDGPTGQGATGQGGGSTTTTGIGGDIGFGGMGVGGSCERTCAADLKGVVDCHGVIVETCGGDQACLNGLCTNDPCGAAEAAQSSYGCDYWAVKPDLISAGKGACFGVYVANTWDVPVHLTVGRAGQDLGTSFIAIPQGQGTNITYAAYDPTAGLPVGQVALVFLSHEDPSPSGLPICPMPAAMNAESGVLGTGRGQAFHIQTDRPVVAYSILPYGGGPSAATSATLLLPTSAWDTNYIAVNAYQKSQVVSYAQPSLNILAYLDGTEVTILPKAAVVGGVNVVGGPPNAPITYTLAAGEYVQLSQDVELSGSPIQSNEGHPIGLWGAASCLNVPAGETACDSAHQQIPPVRALGSEYVGVRHSDRTLIPGEDTPPWRLVGAVNGTTLTWLPATPAGAPTSLNLGDVAEFAATGPFVVKSQDVDHPFYFAQYMTGSNMYGEGDPEWVNVIPVAQYLDDYVLFTDPTYPETELVVVRRPSLIDGTFADVNLDCAGAIAAWENVGDYQFARVRLVTGNFQNVGNCSNGLHLMSSDVAFGVTVWGWGGPNGYLPGAYGSQWVSYAYPAGASVQAINEVVVPPVPR